MVKRFAMLLVVASFVVTPIASASAERSLVQTANVMLFDAVAPAQACCKICRKGKACGDGCIARVKVCTKGPGCACDG
jgi:hypothetical protein